MTTVRSLFIGTFVGIFLLLSITYFAVAFTGPTQAPATESGIIAVSGTNVGVGISNPTDRFQVSYSNANSAVPGLSINTTAGSGQAVLGFRTSGTLRGTIRSDTGGNLVLSSGGTGDIYFGTPDGTWRMFIEGTNGNTGIGNIAPGAYKLNVTGDINFTGNLYQNGTLFSSGGGQWTNGAGVLYPTSTAAKVAIGATTVAAGGKFRVDGKTGLTTEGWDYGAVLSVGGPSTNYPGNSGWYTTWNSNILLTGTDATSISFHDAGQNLASLRYQNLNFYLGQDIGWGSSTVNIGGPLVLGKYSADPTTIQTPGMMYFNTATGAFRCYATSTWSNCGGGAVYQ